jgi:hypothetical protein
MPSRQAGTPSPTVLHACVFIFLNFFSFLPPGPARQCCARRRLRRALLVDSRPPPCRRRSLLHVGSRARFSGRHYPLPSCCSALPPLPSCCLLSVVFPAASPTQGRPSSVCAHVSRCARRITRPRTPTPHMPMCSLNTHPALPIRHRPLGNAHPASPIRHRPSGNAHLAQRPSGNAHPATPIRQRPSGNAHPAMPIRQRPSGNAHPATPNRQPAHARKPAKPQTRQPAELSDRPGVVGGIGRSQSSRVETRALSKWGPVDGAPFVAV